MSEFILDMGDKHGLFDRLPEIAQGFIEAACFTGITDEAGNEFQPSLDDLTRDAVLMLAGIAFRFGRDNADILERATEYNPDYDLLQAGRDLWFSCNGHGVGFRDRYLPDDGVGLDALAQCFGGVDLFGQPGSVDISRNAEPISESDLKTELPDVGGQFGAQIGRAVHRDDDDTVPVIARRITVDENGYDAGGAYWGIGENLWKIHTVKDHGALAYIRAETSDAAILKYYNGER